MTGTNTYLSLKSISGEPIEASSTLYIAYMQHAALVQIPLSSIFSTYFYVKFEYYCDRFVTIYKAYGAISPMKFYMSS